MISDQQVKSIQEIVSKYRPTLLGIFGSYARNENTSDSDLDVLIDFNIKINLLEIIGLEQELSEILGIKVDLVTLKSVNEALRHHIDNDLIRII